MIVNVRVRCRVVLVLGDGPPNDTMDTRISNDLILSPCTFETVIADGRNPLHTAVVGVFHNPLLKDG